MNLYNKIMEIFWLVMGIAILVFAAYAYFNDMHTEEIRYFFMAGSMAIILAVFRILYRKKS